ncbi:MAG TPA: cupin domain-containing protein [Acidimicrobiales bacterium]|nr:cupin domain-containing protein [Acidimicrobiales bacterium]
MAREKAALELASDDSNEFDVGQRLRRIRLARKLTLSKVAMSAGISEGFLSQIERGVGNASIATLRSVAGVLGVEMRDLFDESFDRVHAVLYARDRPVLSFGDMGTKYLLTPALDRNLEAFITELNPRGTTGDEPYVHGDSEELMLVLAGKIEFHLDDQVFHLGAWDSVVFRSSTPHLAREISGEPAKLLFVATPPSF